MKVDIDDSSVDVVARLRDMLELEDSWVFARTVKDAIEEIEQLRSAISIISNELEDA